MINNKLCSPISYRYRGAQFVEKPIPFIKLQPDFVQERGKRLGKADR